MSHSLGRACPLPGKPFIAWELSDDTVICCESKKPLAKDLPKGPQPLRSFLNFLESLGHVRVKLHLHEVTKKEGQAGGHYDVKNTEPAVMELKVAEGEKVTTRSLGSHIDLGAIKDSQWVQVIHRLQFDAGTNKIMSGYPGVYVKQPLRIKKGDVFNLLA